VKRRQENCASLRKLDTTGDLISSIENLIPGEEKKRRLSPISKKIILFFFYAGDLGKRRDLYLNPPTLKKRKIGELPYCAQARLEEEYFLDFRSKEMFASRKRPL